MTLPRRYTEALEARHGYNGSNILDSEHETFSFSRRRQKEMYLALCLMLSLSVSHAMQGTKTLAGEQLTAWEKYEAKNNSVIFWKLHPALINSSMTSSGRGPCANIELDEPLARGFLKSCRTWRYNQILGVCDLSCGSQVIVMCWQKKQWYPLSEVPFCSETPQVPTLKQRCKVPAEMNCTSVASQQLVPLHSNSTCVCAKNCREVTLTCTAGGIWTGGNRCNAESYLDGALMVDVNETSLFFSCTENHRLVGHNNATCLSGLLSHPKPVCEAIQGPDIIQLSYGVSLVLIVICLCMAGIVFVLRRRRSNKIQRRPVARTQGFDTELVQPAVRPDTSHYEAMNVMCASVMYDEIPANTEYANSKIPMSYPKPEYINSSELRLK